MTLSHAIPRNVEEHRHKSNIAWNITCFTCREFSILIHRSSSPPYRIKQFKNNARETEEAFLFTVYVKGIQIYGENRELTLFFPVPFNISYLHSSMSHPIP
jgi:hypothetical protein